MATISRTIITTDVKATMVYKVDKEEVSIPLGTVTLEGEYAPIKAARKVRKNPEIAKAIEDVKVNAGVKTYDVIAECEAHADVYTMELADFIKYANKNA